MAQYFYGKITKSGSKLLINIPYDERDNFVFRSKVKVFLLDIEEIIHDDVVRGEKEEPKLMDISDAKEIIKSYDKQYDFTTKSGSEIREYAKELVKE